ncbi:MAG: BrnT family toxin [Roseiarcus sp.]
MKIEFDPTKSARNVRNRGLPFELTADLDWSAARVRRDQRRDYGEERFVALVPMSARLYVVCYCVRGDARRIISFRKANQREERAYAKTFG